MHFVKTSYFHSVNIGTVPRFITSTKTRNTHHPFFVKPSSLKLAYKYCKSFVPLMKPPKIR